MEREDGEVIMGICASLHQKRTTSTMPVELVVSSIRTKVPRLHSITDSSILRSRSRLRSVSVSPDETVDVRLASPLEDRPLYTVSS